MGIAPTGRISVNHELLRQHVADCPTWQAFVQATTKEQAANRIHIQTTPDPEDGNAYRRDELEALRPFATVFTAETDGFGADATAAHGDGFSYTDSGRLKLTIEADIRTELSRADALIEFDNMLGTLLDEILARSGQGGYLAIGRLTFDVGPVPCKRMAVGGQGSFLYLEMGIEWGGYGR